MKKVLALVLALALVCSLMACAKDSTPTPTTNAPTVSAPTDPEPTDPEPTDPEPTDPEPTDPEPTDPETQEVPTYQDLVLATILINDYTWYAAVGACCNHELVSEDLSAYLSYNQKQIYFNQQYRLLCCHTPQEVYDHINRTISINMQFLGHPNDLLFTDNRGNLYLIILPTGFANYRYPAVARANGCLYARAGVYDEDGWYADAYFTIETIGDQQVITQLYFSTDSDLPTEIRDLDYCTPT